PGLCVRIVLPCGTRCSQFCGDRFLVLHSPFGLHGSMRTLTAFTASAKPPVLLTETGRANPVATPIADDPNPRLGKDFSAPLARVGCWRHSESPRLRKFLCPAWSDQC